MKHFVVEIGPTYRHCLKNWFSMQSDAVPNVFAIILDGSAIVQILKTSNTGTFESYAIKTFVPYLETNL